MLNVKFKGSRMIKELPDPGRNERFYIQHKPERGWQSVGDAMDQQRPATDCILTLGA